MSTLKLKKVGLILLVAFVLGAMLFCVLGLGLMVGREQGAVQTVVVEVTPTVDIMATANAGATQLIGTAQSEAGAQATALLDQAQMQATMARVTSTAQAFEVQADMTKTSVQATLAATNPPLISGTPATAGTEVPAGELKIAIVDDNGDLNYREQASVAIIEAFPIVEVLTFQGCDTELVTQKWILVVMDYNMSGSLDGGACTRAILIANPSTEVIGWAAAEREQSFKDAGARGFVAKSASQPNIDLLVEEAKKLLEDQ